MRSLNDKIACSVPCPVCEAPAGQDCVTQFGDNIGKRATVPHKPRQTAGQQHLRHAVAQEKKSITAEIFPAVNALEVQVGGDHYKDSKIQPVEFIEANELGFLEGCMVKRLTRHNKDSGKGREDIEKVIHEAQLLLQLRYGS